MGLTLEPSCDLSSDVPGAPVVVSAAMLLLAYFPTGAPSIHSGATVYLAHCVPGPLCARCCVPGVGGVCGRSPYPPVSLPLGMRRWEGEREIATVIGSREIVQLPLETLLSFLCRDETGRNLKGFY